MKNNSPRGLAISRLAIDQGCKNDESSFNATPSAFGSPTNPPDVGRKHLNRFIITISAKQGIASSSMSAVELHFGGESLLAEDFILLGDNPIWMELFEH